MINNNYCYLRLCICIFCTTVILMLFMAFSFAEHGQEAEEKVYIMLKPQAELGEAPTITISQPLFDAKTNTGKISIKTEPVGFWRSKRAFNKTIYDIFEIPDSSYTTKVGEPMISTISVEIEIPADAALKKIKEKPTIIKTFDNILLAPQQEPLPVARPMVQEKKFIQEKPTFTINRDIYSQKTPYPGIFSAVITDTFFGERHILIIKLYPLQFYPAQKEIKIYLLETDIIFTK
jgi:hypothetical protein